MSRYANRPPRQLPPPPQHYNQPSGYYAEGQPHYTNNRVGYPTEDDDEDTMVATDVSAMPPARGGARMTWGQNDTRSFDKTAPPQSVGRPRQSGAPSLAVPSAARPRAASFDGSRRQGNHHSEPEHDVAWGRNDTRYYDEDGPPDERPARQPRQPYRDPRPEYDDDGEDYAPPPPRQAHRAPPPRQAYQAPPPPPQDRYSSFLGHDEEEGNSSDDDKFTAVGTGVATDLDLDGEEETVVNEASGYGRDPRAQPRGVAVTDGYDGWHQPGSQRGFASSPQPSRRTFLDEDLGPPPINLAPPCQVQRPTSSGGMRRYEEPPTRYEAPARYETLPTSRPPPPSVPEDSPEERNLIRLLKDMNFSMALKDFHDTFSIGVQKTIVAADGMGHAYTKIHCKKLPRADVVAKDPHLNRHWVPLTGNRWLFKTESHKVEILFKTAGLAAYEAAAKWVNGLSEENKSGYTNILRISRALEHHDARSGGSDPIPQIVYYGSGVGSDPGIASYGEGLTGAGLATKVEETYAFLAGNYVQGDEIALFGFSRGAYTARMVAGIIGEIGLLGKVEMERFPSLFLTLQAEGAAKKDDTATLEKSRKILEPFRTRAQAQIKAAGGFLIKLVGVFDTVGAMGLPTELHKTHPKAASIFGFSNTDLGSHIQLALHAMALNETRRDFIVTKWTQTEEGRAKGQTLKQVWFAGSHSDVGGGWQDAHDLADVALAWMVSNTAHVLAFDPNYIRSIPNPTAPYGEQPPHNPEVGIFTLAASEVRSPPTSSTFPTAETIHYSVTKQPKVTPAIAQSLAASPSLVRPLEGFEKLFAESWDLGQPQRPKPQTLTALTQQVDHPSSEMGGVHRAFAELEDLAERVSGIKIPGHAAT